MIKYLTLCPRAAKWLKKTVNLPFALCSASDSQHVSVSVESRPGLPGSPGGSKRSWKHREKHPDLLCFLLLPVLCIDILPDPCVCFSCGTTHGFQKHEFICFVGWWTCLYLGQGSEKLRIPRKKVREDAEELHRERGNEQEREERIVYVAWSGRLVLEKGWRNYFWFWIGTDRWIFCSRVHSVAWDPFSCP